MASAGLPPPAFDYAQYSTAELYKQVIDVEDTHLVSGDGTGTNMIGFFNTSGILTQ